MSRPLRLYGVVSRETLCERIDALTATHRLVGPVARDEPRCDPPRRYFYESVSSSTDLDLEFDYCVYSPKAVLLPPRETLLRYDTTTGKFGAVATIDASPTALIGVHPCDIHAIRLLDEVFTRDQRDRHYLDRRANTLVVGIDCPSLCTPGAFCREMHAFDAITGFDVMLHPLPARENGATSTTLRSATDYGVRFGTDAGRAWLSAAVRKPTAEDARRFERYLERKSQASPPLLQMKRSEIPALLRETYDSLVWAATAQRCYSCGSCNLVCPTCYCFDIHDETELPAGRGVRERTWDACMLAEFAVVAGNHNFRAKAAQRLRHRISRKGSWIEHRTGMSGCVGCGRCTRACTAQISIVDVLNQLAGERRTTAGAALPGAAPRGDGHGSGTL